MTDPVVPYRIGDAVGPNALIVISPSLKPAPGHTASSASRTLLALTVADLRTVYPDIHLMDLRTLDVPPFCGLMPSELDPEPRKLIDAIKGCGAVLFGVPAYWSAVSASFKNLIELACGPAYDHPFPWTTVFTGKPVGLVIIGADSASTTHASAQAQSILISTGARICGDPVTLTDPRRNAAAFEATRAETLALGALLIQTIFSGHAP